MAATFPYLSYSDGVAAIAWLEAIGFVAVVRHDDEGGAVRHAELRLSDAVIMVATADADYTVAPLVDRSTGNGIYLHVEDVGAIYAAAVDAGATPVFPPETTEWGTDRARVRDPEGHEWSFGTYRPGAGW